MDSIAAVSILISIAIYCPIKTSKRGSFSHLPKLPLSHTIVIGDNATIRRFLDQGSNTVARKHTRRTRKQRNGCTRDARSTARWKTTVGAVWYTRCIQSCTYTRVCHAVVQYYRGNFDCLLFFNPLPRVLCSLRPRETPQA